MKKIIVLIFLVFAFKGFSQNSPKELVDTFFETYKTNAGKAVQDLYATNQWTDRIKDDIDKIVGMVNGFTENYMGKYYGYELITKRKFAESFILYSYLVKYDRQPLRFIFKFYKPNDKWVLLSYSLDDNLGAEIEESAKLYYLDLDNKN